MKKVSSYLVYIVSLGLLFTVASVSCAKENMSGEKKSKQSKADGALAKKDGAGKEEKQKKSKQRKINVYYFHTTNRCYSCNTIEALTKEAVEQTFAEHLKDSSLTFSAINIEEKGNEHFVEDYKLYTKSVIVSEVIGGSETKWENLDKVWQLLRKPDAFKKYIVEEIQPYL